MKKRPLVLGVSGLVVLIAGWFLSPDLRAVVYELGLQHGSVRVQRWAVERLEGLGGAGDLALVQALGERGDEAWTATVAEEAGDALIRRRAVRALGVGLQDPDPVIRLRAAETVLLWLDALCPRLSIPAVWVPAEDGGGPKEKAALQALRRASATFRAGLAENRARGEPRGLSVEDRALFSPLLPAVLAGVEDPEPRVRARSMRILARFPERGEAVIPQLIRGLRHSSRHVREAAGAALESQGPKVWPRLATSLPEFVVALSELSGAAPSDPDIAALNWLLPRLSKRGLGAPDLIARLLDGPHEAVWEAAVESLARLGDPGYRALIDRLIGPAEARVTERLVAELSSKRSSLLGEKLKAAGPALRLRVLALLHHGRPSAIAGPVLAAFDDPRTEVRRAAIAVCRVWGDRFDAGRRALLRAAERGEAEERIAALDALSSYALRRERSAVLAAALEARDIGLRVAATEEISRLVRWEDLGEESGRFLPMLFRNLEDADPALREASFEALDSFGLAAAPLFLAELDSPSAEKRARAARVLGGIALGSDGFPSDWEVEARVRLLLGDARAFVREEAATSLGNISDGEAASLKALRLVMNRDSEAEVRAAAREAWVGLSWRGS